MRRGLGWARAPPIWVQIYLPVIAIIAMISLLVGMGSVSTLFAARPHVGPEPEMAERMKVLSDDIRKMEAKLQKRDDRYGGFVP